MNDCFILANIGLIFLVTLPPPLSPLVNRVSAMGRGMSEFTSEWSGLWRFVLRSFPTTGRAPDNGTVTAVRKIMDPVCKGPGANGRATGDVEKNCRKPHLGIYLEQRRSRVCPTPTS